MELSDKRRELTHATFQEITKRELRPSYDLTGLRLLREKAARERDLRELHRTSRMWGRAPYELLQNADDVGATRAVFILSHDGLAFAHDGRWFTIDNFRSLADGWSDKNPNECIGHKGLGFRSVLDNTPAPHLFKVSRNEFFGVKFSWAVNNGHIEETLRVQPDLREYRNKWVTQAQPYCPIMAIPTLAKKASMASSFPILDHCARDRYGPNLTTVFWFPAKDPDLPPHLSRELSPRAITADAESRKLLKEFVSNDLATILPFLSHIEAVTVYEGGQQLCAARRSAAALNEGSAETTIVIENDANMVSSQTLLILREAFSIPSQVKNLPDTPVALRRMDQAKAALAVRLNPQPVPEGSAVFHVYFPTEERTGSGFTIHGDFYVKPDRTRLMPGKYNLWLLEQIARLSATKFLDHLLGRYRPAKVYEALAPIGQAAGSEIEASFMRLNGDALKKRTSPFVATSKGLLRPQEVALPPTVDEPGFWESHFGDTLPILHDGKSAFFKPAEDTPGARSFLQFAGLAPLRGSAFLHLLERAGEERQTAEWWYECYSYMAHDQYLARQEHETFVGRRILLAGQEAIAVPKKQELIVSLPPTGAATELSLPPLFSDAFVLLNMQLAELLRSGPDTVESWVLTKFHVSRFEATELLPRAIRRAAPRIFRGLLQPTVDDLADAWIFIRGAVSLSRRIESSEFWQDVGRFPVVLEAPRGEAPHLAPVFLVYWPDALINASSPLFGVGGLRRLNPTFITKLQERSGVPAAEWHSFLQQAGLSANPKLLRFSRIQSDETVIVNPDGHVVAPSLSFQGERQVDENVGVLTAIRKWTLWDTDSRPHLCTHPGQRVLQSLTFIDGFLECVEKAVDEYRHDDPKWRERLWGVIQSLPTFEPTTAPDASLLCRAGGPQGHPIPVGNQVLRQLTTSLWLPSTLGPAPLGVAFARLATRRLIGTGTTGDELGDSLLPYVIAPSALDLERLRQLRVDILEDAPSTRPQALARALRLLGETLSSSPMRDHVLGQPSRRRLVRGAIQEIYRALNQATDIPPLSGVKLAVRATAGIDFSTGPFFFADPGSPVERAFIDRLALIDVDRPYPRLFDALGLRRLIIGQTVEETLLSADRAIPMESLRREIVERVGPYLLALLLVRAEPDHAKLVVRRLTERFEVLSLPGLKVSLALPFDPETRVETDFPHAYIRKHLEPGRGAVEEAHYALYLTVAPETSLGSLDGDALGEVLARVFLDGISDEFLGLFPRIVTRYQHTAGDQTEMEKFLLEHLGVSREAQEGARMLLAGEEGTIPTEPPPPAIVIGNIRLDRTRPYADLAHVLADHEDQLKAQAQGFVQRLLVPGSTAAQKTHPPAPSIPPHITPEQKLRGRRGEDEILRRLRLPGGWEGFGFVADDRDPPRGYDFLASLGDREVKIEIKTFSPGGQIVVTEGELREAATSRDDYYLVGVLDDGGSPAGWKTAILPDPIEMLLKEGRFSSKPELRLSSEALFRDGRP